MMHDREQARARAAYEQMARRLAELDRADGIDLSVPMPSSPNAPRRRRAPRPLGRRARTPSTHGSLFIVAVLLVAVLGVTGWWREALDLEPAGAAAATDEQGIDWPPVPADADDDRLLPAVAPRSAGEHEFLNVRADGRPVTYDPCRPLHFVINPAGSPPDGISMVRTAVERVSAATGLRIVDDGVTDEDPTSDRSPLQVDRYGNRWAPVLIAWSTEGELDQLGGDVAGFGGSHVLAPGGVGTERYVSGQVVLDAEVYRELGARPEGIVSGTAIVMHELAHVVGLDHVDDPAEMMHSDNSGQTTFGPGDREGLAVLGAGDCHSDT